MSYKLESLDPSWTLQERDRRKEKQVEQDIHGVVGSIHTPQNSSRVFRRVV